MKKIEISEDMTFPRRMQIGGAVRGWGRGDGTGPNPDCPLKKKVEDACKK